MSTTGEQSPATTSGSAESTQRLSRPRAQTDTGNPMRDGAMARTAPRRDVAGVAARARAMTRGGDTDQAQGYAAPGHDRQTGAPPRTDQPGRRDPARRPAAPPAGTESRSRASTGPSVGTATAGATGASTARSSDARPAANRGRATTRAPRRTGPRRVRLTLQRIDPWSVMKISFLVSVALGIAGVVMVAVLWTVLSGMNVFSTVNDLIVEITTGETSATNFDLMNYLGFGRVVSLAVVVGVINVILLTALATLTAFLYNVCTALVGGAQLTLSDE